MPINTARPAARASTTSSRWARMASPAAAAITPTSARNSASATFPHGHAIMQFEVRALSTDQAAVTMSTCVIDARDEADARRQAEARGLFISAIRPLRTTPFSAAGRQRARALPLLLFSQELLALLNAGLGIVEALEALLEKEGATATRSVLTRLLEGLREGKRFSAVLAEQAELCPPLYIGIVKAAEGTSDLPRALSRYIDYQQRIDAVRSKIVSAAIYPAILLAVGGPPQPRRPPCPASPGGGGGGPAPPLLGCGAGARSAVVPAGAGAAPGG